MQESWVLRWLVANPWASRGLPVFTLGVLTRPPPEIIEP